jgi:transcriptional regulator with XRE-family HTH domain
MWQQKVSNKALGAALGIDPTAVGKKLRAEQKFSVEQLATIARELGTSIAYLVGETDDPTPPDDENSGPRRARTDDPRINGTSLWPDLYGDTDIPPVVDLNLVRERRRTIMVEVSA